MTWLSRLAKASLLPVVVWLGGLAAFAALAINGLFDGPNPVFVIARVTGYVAVATVVAVTLGFVAIFGIACGAMLAWLGESSNPRIVVTAMGRSFWCLASYVWLGVVLLIVEPPVGLTVFEMAQPDALEARVEGTTAFAWMTRLRYVALGAFLVIASWLLARHARPLNVVLSVAFGAVALSAVVTGLGLLAGPSPAP